MAIIYKELFLSCPNLHHTISEPYEFGSRDSRRLGGSITMGSLLVHPEGSVDSLSTISESAGTLRMCTPHALLSELSSLCFLMDSANVQIGGKHPAMFVSIPSVQTEFCR